MRDPVVATRETTVASAARIMRENHVGSVIVVDRMDEGLRLPVGIVTDRDLVVEVLATGLDSETITVGDIMDPNLVTIAARNDASSAVHLMRVKAVRRLPVVNDEGRLLGLVSFDDLLDVITEELQKLAETSRLEQSREARQRK